MYICEQVFEKCPGVLEINESIQNGYIIHDIFPKQYNKYVVDIVNTVLCIL